MGVAAESRSIAAAAGARREALLPPLLPPPPPPPPPSTRSRHLPPTPPPAPLLQGVPHSHTGSSSSTAQYVSAAVAALQVAAAKLSTPVPDAVERRCQGTLGAWCEAYHTQAEIPATTAPRGNQTCSLDCNKVREVLGRRQARQGPSSDPRLCSLLLLTHACRWGHAAL